MSSIVVDFFVLFCFWKVSVSQRGALSFCWCWRRGWDVSRWVCSVWSSGLVALVMFSFLTDMSCSKWMCKDCCRGCPESSTCPHPRLRKGRQSCWAGKQARGRRRCFYGKSLPSLCCHSFPTSSSNLEAKFLWFPMSWAIRDFGSSILLGMSENTNLEKTFAFFAHVWKVTSFPSCLLTSLLTKKKIHMLMWRQLGVISL